MLFDKIIHQTPVECVCGVPAASMGVPRREWTTQNIKPNQTWGTAQRHVATLFHNLIGIEGGGSTRYIGPFKMSNI